MTRILIPVDAFHPQRTRAALADAVKRHAKGRVDVHLLNVQPAVTGHVAMFFSQDDLHALQQAAGEEDLAPAKALLDQHHVPYKASVRIGRSAQTIADTARELDCDQILLGDEEQGAGGFHLHLFGSLSQQLRQLIGASGGHCQVIGT